MEYTTHHDIGDRKREGGINEDSVAVSVFEEGHRDGYRGQPRPPRSTAVAKARPESQTRRTEDEAAESERTGDESDGGRTGTSVENERTHVKSREVGTGAESGDESPADGEQSAPAGTGSTVGVDAPANRSAAVFALADGAGGHDAGDVASYLATTTICERLAGTAVRAARSDPGAFDLEFDEPLPRRPRAGDLESAVAEAIVEAHREVLRYADASDQHAHTTVVAGVVVDGALHYGWVGDSRAYLVNAAREEISRLTRDHAVVEELNDAGRIDDVEALVHPRGNEITRALGGAGRADPETATVEVETETVPLYAEDVVLVTSDGIVDAQTEAAKLHEWYLEADRDDEMAAVVRDRAVTDAEIRDCVLSAASMDAAAADLIAMANDRGGKDNLSAILMRDGTLPSTPDDPPPRSIDAEADIEDRQTVVGDDD